MFPTKVISLNGSNNVLLSSASYSRCFQLSVDAGTKIWIYVSSNIYIIFLHLFNCREKWNWRYIFILWSCVIWEDVNTMCCGLWQHVLQILSFGEISVKTYLRRKQKLFISALSRDGDNQTCAERNSWDQNICWEGKHILSWVICQKKV